MPEPSPRLNRIPSYVFATIGAKIDDLKSKGVDVIRMDIGSPDLPPADHIIEALVESAWNDSLHGYMPFGGTPEYRRACARYYGERFQVDLDPRLEVVGLIGSKEGIFHITQAYCAQENVVLIPDPGYPVYHGAAAFAGAQVVFMPLLAENDFLPDFDSIDEQDARRAKIMWLNYPNNPTGAAAGLEFFEKAIEFARRWDILLCHDSPYAEVTFGDFRAPSVLELEGASDHAVEFNSLSKSFNMAGWRLGMAVGNREAVAALSRLKSQIDTSHFGPVLAGGVAALDGDKDWLEDRNSIYAARRDLILAAVDQLGMAARPPAGAIYVWARLPKSSSSSMEFASRLLEETGVSVTPGVTFGEHGEGYVRISLGVATERVREAMDRLVEWGS